jgi:hypothetical protein
MLGEDEDVERKKESEPEEPREHPSKANPTVGSDEKSAASTGVDAIMQPPSNPNLKEQSRQTSS